MLVAFISLTYCQRHVIGMENAQQQLLNIVAIYGEKRYFYPVQDALQFIMLMLLEGASSETALPASREHELAFELAGLLSQYPALRAIFQHFPAFRSLATAEAELSPDLVAAARSRGRERDLWATAAALLEELPALGWLAPDAEEPLHILDA